MNIGGKMSFNASPTDDFEQVTFSDNINVWALF